MEIPEGVAGQVQAMNDARRRSEFLSLPEALRRYYPDTYASIFPERVPPLPGGWSPVWWAGGQVTDA